MPRFGRLWGILNVTRPPLTVAAAQLGSKSGRPSAIVRPVRFTRGAPPKRLILLNLTGYGLLTWILLTRLTEIEKAIEKALGDVSLDDLEKEEVDAEFQKLKNAYGADPYSKPALDLNEGRLLFLPLSRRRVTSLSALKPEDPNWKAMVDFSKDEQLKQKALEALFQSVIAACTQQPKLANQLGPAPYVCRDVLEFEYLMVSPPTWEQDGIDITDSGIWYTTRYMTSRDARKSEKALWPAGMILSIRMTGQELAQEYKDLARERWKKFRVDVEKWAREPGDGSRPVSSEPARKTGEQSKPARSRRRRWTHELPEDEEGNAASTSPSIDQIRKGSKSPQPEQEGVQNPLSGLAAIPKPIRHISHNLAIAAISGKMHDKANSYYAPTGSVKLTGTIEVHSKKEYISVKVQAWYDVHNDKWDRIDVHPRPRTTGIVQRQTGMLRRPPRPRPAEDGQDSTPTEAKPEPETVTQKQADDSKKES